MITQNNLNNRSLIFDVKLYDSDSYDFKLVDSETNKDIKIQRNFEYYDVEITNPVSLFDVKLNFSEYYDFEIVTGNVNYLTEGILKYLGNEIMTEGDDFIITEDDVYIIY